jgi:hypothetical protein
MIDVMAALRASRVYFASVLAGSWLLAAAAPVAAQEACFERIDNGTDKTGWHVSATNHHGPGSGWTVEDGAFVGRQTAGQLGGILMTDKLYKDVEVVFEVKIDWGCDSGFFFRTTAGDRAYQVNVDHLAESGVGTIYGEGFYQELRAIPYFLTDMGNAAVAAPNQTPSFDLAQWPTIWHPTEFNEIRARVEGNPPHMQVWISDLKVMDFTDQMLRTEIDAMGPLAIQVHMGTRWIENGSVSYRNIRVKDLTVPCDEPDPGTGGMGGMSGAGGNASGAGGTAGGNGGSSAGQSSAGSGGIASGGVAGAAGSSTTPSAGSIGAGGSAPLAPAASDDSGGCGCAVPRGGRGSGAAACLALVLGLLWRRRQAS